MFALLYRKPITVSPPADVNLMFNALIKPAGNTDHCEYLCTLVHGRKYGIYQYMCSFFKCIYIFPFFETLIPSDVVKPTLQFVMKITCNRIFQGVQK